MEYRYSPVNGALLSLGPPGGSVNYYSIDARDPAERVAQETYGTATSRTLGYHSIFNLLASAKATQGGTVIQDLVLTYDGRRDLSTRTDNAVTLATPSGTSEGFHYDALGRLRQWVSFLGSYSVDYQYDDMGNMTSRQVTQGGTTSPADVFHFAEHGRSAQQLTSAPWGAYDYDAVGDQVTGPGRTVGYAPFHLPVSVAATGGSTQLEYDAWHHRSYKQSGSGNITYVTGAYERRADAAGVHHIVHLSAEGREVGELAVDESAPTAAPAERYLLADQLGEPLVIVEPNGQVVRPRLEPFGTRLSSGDTPSPGNSGDPSVHIGFGGSEHDDELGLINMNGRLYDPRISRFLSVDPLVASLRFSQAHHRYAYAFNSPLSHFDPSGFLTEGPDQSQESAWESACRLHGECGMSVIDFTHATSTGNQGQTCADVGTSDTFGNSAGQSSASDPGAEGTTVETPYITVETSGYSYIRDRVIGKETPGNSGTSSSAVMKQLQQNPNKFFPFRVNAHDPQKTGGAIMDREKYNLNGFDPHLDLPPGDHPVEVTNVTPTSFTFVTQKGHFDPPGSTITFRTYTDASGSIHLVHEAHTTPAGLSFVPLAAPSFAAKAWDYQETMLGMYLQQQQSNFTPSLPKSPF